MGTLEEDAAALTPTDRALDDVAACMRSTITNEELRQYEAEQRRPEYRIAGALVDLLTATETLKAFTINPLTNGLVRAERQDIELAARQLKIVLALTQPDTECDCCGERRFVSRCWAYGIETFACDECRGVS